MSVGKRLQKKCKSMYKLTEKNTICAQKIVFFLLMNKANMKPEIEKKI